MVLLSQSRLYGSNVDTRDWGDSAYERGGDGRWKFGIKPLKETDLGVAKAFLTPKRDHVRRRVIGRPFDDPKGRWRVGGGINVPVKIKRKQLEARSGN